MNCPLNLLGRALCVCSSVYDARWLPSALCLLLGHSSCLVSAVSVRLPASEEAARDTGGTDYQCVAQRLDAVKYRWRVVLGV